MGIKAEGARLKVELIPSTWCTNGWEYLFRACAIRGERARGWEKKSNLLCPAPHYKSDWYSLIPANYCHFVWAACFCSSFTVHFFIFASHTINSTQILLHTLALCTIADVIFFSCSMLSFFFYFFTRGHRVALSTDTMCTICIVFTCSTTATLFNYLIYLTSRKKRPTPSPPWNIEQSVKGGKNCVFGQHCRAQLKMVIGWSSISVLKMESVQYNS